MQVVFGIMITLLIIFIIYLLLIMPSLIIHNPAIAPFYKVLYAHRGLHDNESDAPENSLAAFQKAVDAGYGIELDIQLTKDKEVVVFHDYTLKRVCGEVGRVDEYTYEELKHFKLLKSEEKIPKLTEVLTVINGKEIRRAHV